MQMNYKTNNKPKEYKFVRQRKKNGKMSGE